MVGNEATGQWMRNSAVDNPRFLAATIGNFLGWKTPTTQRSYAELSATPALDKGKYLFSTRCSACHTVGKGDALGPDLQNVTRRRDRAWLSTYLDDPDKLLAGGDRVAKELLAKYRGVRMPRLGLDQAEISALLAYVEAESGTAAARR